uniref:Zinc finger piccolo-type domain-containing protein n=1 Tax=Anabas testudineus TaxID=64144 RepID=A0A3Q1H708_ANATE
MQRALSASELTGPQLKPQGAASKTSPSVVNSKITAQGETLEKKELSKCDAPLNKEAQMSDTLQKKGSPIPGSPKRAQPTTVTQTAEATKRPESDRQTSPAPSQKTTKPEPKQSKVTPDTQQESGNIGKMFGFGSSIFSSASTLITSAVQDQSTPPVSPKMSHSKEKSPALQKLEQQKKIEPSQQTKPPPSEQLKADTAPSEPSKAPAAPTKPVKLAQSTCPLCKIELNMGSKDLPNYSTCTECKNTVCNQCGFNPIKVLIHRLSNIASIPSPKPAKPQKKDIISPVESPQRKPSVTQPATAADKPEVQKQATPILSQKMPQEPQKTSAPNKSPDPIRKAEHETGGFFGFGGGKSQPAKPAESVSGKMLGFSSSIFSSASTLITSAVQDQPKTTPPVSPKMSAAKEIKSPVLQKKEEQKKTEQPQQQSKTSPLVQAKVDKEPSEHTKAALASQATVTPGQSTCPLCKVELNMGSKHPPNYNTCTECKNTVCNQCGFNPMPNVSEVSEIHLMYIPTFDMIFTIY